MTYSTRQCFNQRPSHQLLKVPVFIDGAYHHLISPLPSGLTKSQANRERDRPAIVVVITKMDLVFKPKFYYFPFDLSNIALKTQKASRVLQKSKEISSAKSLWLKWRETQ